MSDHYDPFNSLIENANIYDHNTKVVARHIYSYYCSMNKIEKKLCSLNISNLSKEELSSAIEEQSLVFNEYWETESDYWKPCSIGSNEEYNPESILSLTVLSDGNGSFVAGIEYKDDLLEKIKIAYLVQQFDGKPKIVNKFF